MSGYTDLASDFFYSDFFFLSKSVFFRPLDSPNRLNKAPKNAYILGSGCRKKKSGYTDLASDFFLSDFFIITNHGSIINSAIPT